jgi:LemA protein
MMLILGIVIVVAFLWLIGTYNRLITLSSRGKEAWADIDVQLKRRYDLIPNLVNTVKGYATHEKEAFENVTRARAAAMGAQTVADQSKAENTLSASLKTLFAVSEAYPDLHANQNFLKLADELSDTENKIQAARRFYNTNVRDLSISIASFPSNLIATTFGFKPLDYFELAGDSKEKESVSVSFS